MNKKLVILIFFCVVILESLKAQIGVGEWRDHLPFSHSIAITQSPIKVYVASETGIFSYSKRNFNLEKLTKVNILSDVGVSSIKYSEENKVLIAGYSNGNIDLIFDNEIFNLSDIKRKMINGSKSVNHILIINEYAYLSCGFGIVVLNIEKREIKDTYYIGDLGSVVHVNQLELSNDNLYAVTNQGIFIADYTNLNLVNYSNWHLETEIPNYTSKFNSIYVNDDGRILVNQVNEFSNDIVYSFTEDIWTSINSDYSSIREIKKTSTSVQIVTNRSVLIYNTNFILQDSITQKEIPNLNPYDIETDNNNIFWFADRGKGLVKYQAGNAEEIRPNAPYLADAFSIDVKNNKVLVAAGGLTAGWKNIFINGAAFSFQNEQWKTTINYSAPDYVTIKIDPNNNNHFFAGSWGGGLIEYENNEIINTFNEENSVLQSVIAGSGYCRIGGIAFDKDNYLWITNSGVENPISVKIPDKELQSFNFDEKISNILVGDIIVTENNHKWVILPSGNGLFVFDNNQTIDNENDDLFKKFSILDENGKIISNNVYSIAEDLDGDIFVGTDQGIVVYYNAVNVFEGAALHAQRIVLTVGDATNFLLATETITSISVDGANRKWIGTHSSGVYLVSEDGTEELNHFTEENSPLLSNNIKDIGINHETGEIFFATDKGLISYRGSATMGSDDFGDVYVYPNPVRENYNGDITIRGLVSDVNVKITDISGNIVYETSADGGQATWSGKNFSGRRVSTGVYLVFCSNDDGSKTYITKLLFIK